MFFGLVIGLVMHRSRFCFVRAFRDPLMTGDAEMVKVVSLSLMIYGLGSAVIKWNYIQPDTMGVFHPFWIGSLLGGSHFRIRHACWPADAPAAPCGAWPKVIPNWVWPWSHLP